MNLKYYMKRMLEKILFKKRLYQDAKKDYEDARNEGTDKKLIMQLRQECRSWLK